MNGHHKLQSVTTAVQPAAGSPGRGRPPKFTPERMQQITNLLERGKSREEIAEIIGVTLGTLQVTCSKLGISLRRPRFDNGTGLLRLRQSRSHVGSQRESTQPAKEYQPGPETKPMEEAQLATPPQEALPEKSNGRALAAFAIRMEYKGEERSTKLPLDQEMIRQLAMEAEFRGMRIGELVAALILSITSRDLFQIVLANAPEQLRASVAASSPEIGKG